MQIFFREGDTGLKVETIQSRLKLASFYPGRVDGFFGPKTKESVMSFQRSRGLVADGVVGPDTWQALELSLEPTPKTILVPNGEQQIMDTFGDPLRPGFWETHAGFCEVPEELEHCFKYKNGQGKRGFYCHKLLIPILQACYLKIVESGLSQELKDFGGCFNIRKTRGGTKLSTHSWAIAVDHNVSENQLGAEPKMDPKIIEIFEKFGFVWGGNFKRKDGMHFQYATGY